MDRSNTVIRWMLMRSVIVTESQASNPMKKSFTKSTNASSVARRGPGFMTLDSSSTAMWLSHIAVELLSNVMKPGPLRATLLAFVDFVKLFFIGLLAWLSVTITERMSIQRMTVFDLSMSWVYAGVGFGCFLMFIRQAINVWRNARTG